MLMWQTHLLVWVEVLDRIDQILEKSITECPQIILARPNGKKVESDKTSVDLDKTISNVINCLIFSKNIIDRSSHRQYYSSVDVRKNLF